MRSLVLMLLLSSFLVSCSSNKVYVRTDASNSTVSVGEEIEVVFMKPLKDRIEVSFSPKDSLKVRYGYDSNLVYLSFLKPGKVETTFYLVSDSRKSKIKTVAYNVEKPKITDISLSKDSFVGLSGPIYRLSFICRDELSNFTDGYVKAETDLEIEEFPSYCKDGHLFIRLRLRPGEHFLTLSSADYSKTFKLIGTQITDFNLPRVKTFILGDKVSFRVIGRDSFDNKKEIRLKINNQEEYAASSLGKKKVVLSYKKIKKPFEFEVVSGEAAYIKVEPKKLSLKAGSTTKLDVQIYNKNHIKIDRPVSFSFVGKKLASITPEGFITATKAGKSRILIKADKARKEIEIEVEPGEVSTLSFKSKTFEITAGSTLDLSLTATDVYGNEFPVDAQIFLLKNLGDLKKNVFYAKKAGLTRVFALKNRDKIISATLKVAPGPIIDLFLQSSNSTEAGSYLPLSVYGVDSFNNKKPIKASFKIISGSGKIDKNFFYSERAGFSIIEASYKDLKKRFKILVVPSSLTSLSISGPDKIRAGEIAEFFVSGRDRFKNPIEVSYAWTILSGPGKMSKTGQFYSEKAGETILKVIGIDSKFKRFISSKKIITILPAEAVYLENKNLEIEAGKTKNLKIKGYDAFGNEIESTINISSNKAGKYPVKIRMNQNEKTLFVNIKPSKPEKLILEVPQRLSSGSCLDLNFYALDKFNNKIKIDPRKIRIKVSNFSRLSVFGPRICAKKTGSVYILAQYKNLSARKKLEVICGPISKIKGEDSISFSADKFFELDYFCEDSFENRCKCNIDYDPKSKVFYIKDGRLYSSKPSSTLLEVTASDNKISISKLVKVESRVGKAHKIQTAVDKALLKAGEILDLKTRSFDKHDFLRPVYSLKVSVYPKKLAEVLSSSLILAKKAGKGYILIKDGSKIKKIPLTVEAGEASLLKVKPSKKMSLKAGSQVFFKVSIKDSFGNKIKANPEYKIVPSLGYFKGSHFYAQTAGRGKILVSYKHLLKEIEIEIKPSKAVRLNLFPVSMSAKAGQKFLIKAVLEDSFGNIVDSKIFYNAPRNIKIERLKTKGYFLVSSKVSGVYLINFYSGRLSSSIRVKIEPASAAELDIYFPRKIEAGQNLKLDYKILDMYNNAIDSDLDIDSNATFERFSENLKFLESGKYYIEFSIGSLKKRFNFQVVPSSPEKIVFKQIKCFSSDSKPLLEAEVIDRYNNFVAEVKDFYIEQKKVDRIDCFLDKEKTVRAVFGPLFAEKRIETLIFEDSKKSFE